MIYLIKNKFLKQMQENMLKKLVQYLNLLQLVLLLVLKNYLKVLDVNFWILTLKMMTKQLGEVVDKDHLVKVVVELNLMLKKLMMVKKRKDAVNFGFK